MIEKYILELNIPALPKIPNNGSHGSFWDVQREKKTWMQFLVLHIGTKRPVKPLEKAHITFTRCSSVPPDYDNLVASFKRVLDILKKLEIIVDDKMSNIGKSDYLFEKTAPGKGHIKIKIEGVSCDQ